MRIQQAAMSPQDVVVLLKIICYGKESWLQVQLAEALRLSQPEISNAIARCRYAELVDASGKQVRKQALLEFLQHGIAYAFPAKPGPIVRGVPTSHSAPPLNRFIESNSEDYVWPSATGKLRGQSVSPLYQNVVKAVQDDLVLHELLALVDAIRIGSAREKEIAREELKKRLA